MHLVQVRSYKQAIGIDKKAPGDVAALFLVHPDDAVAIG